MPGPRVFKLCLVIGDEEISDLVTVPAGEHEDDHCKPAMMDLLVEHGIAWYWEEVVT